MVWLNQAQVTLLHMQGLNDSSDYIVCVAGRDTNTVPGPNYRSPPTELEVRCVRSAPEQCAGFFIYGVASHSGMPGLGQRPNSARGTFGRCQSCL